MDTPLQKESKRRENMIYAVTSGLIYEVYKAIAKVDTNIKGIKIAYAIPSIILGIQVKNDIEYILSVYRQILQEKGYQVSCDKHDIRDKDIYVATEIKW